MSWNQFSTFLSQSCFRSCLLHPFIFCFWFHCFTQLQLITKVSNSWALPWISLLTSTGPIECCSLAEQSCAVHSVAQIFPALLSCECEERSVMLINGTANKQNKICIAACGSSRMPVWRLWDTWLWRWPSGLAGDGEASSGFLHPALWSTGGAGWGALGCGSRNAAALALGIPQVLPQVGRCCKWFVVGIVGVVSVMPPPLGHVPCPELAVLGFAGSNSVFVRSDQVRAVLLGRISDKDPRMRLNISCVCVYLQRCYKAAVWVKYWQFMNDVHVHLLIAV